MLLVVPVGGLGLSQLGDIVNAIAPLPGVEILSWDRVNEYGDSADIWAFLNAHPESPAYLIGHSLGVDQAISCALLLKERCVGVALLDPVWFEKPNPGCPALVFHADNSFPFPQGSVKDITGTTIEGTTHNSLAHDPRVIAKIVDVVRTIAR